MALTRFFASRTGMAVAGAAIGVMAGLLQQFGNPPNMGLCMVCFSRDVAGAIGLHRADVVQYLRPEIMGAVFGALIAAVAGKEWRPRAGSAPVVRFLLGVFAVIGALAFLGCPWRAMMRLAGGDWNALTGLGGLVVGVGVVAYLAPSAPALPDTEVPIAKADDPKRRAPNVAADGGTLGDAALLSDAGLPAPDAGVQPPSNLSPCEREERAKDALERARKALEAGDPQAAGRALDEAARFDPEHPDIPVLRRRL